MAFLPAAVLYDLLQWTTTGDNRQALESRPALAWLLPNLDAKRDRLAELLPAEPAPEALADLRQRLEQADDRHDSFHRYGFALLQAGSVHPDPATAQTVATGLAILYPEGLRFINRSYRAEAIDNAAFRARLQRPEVRAAFDATPYAAELERTTQQATEAGDDLNDLLHELETTKPPRPSPETLVRARREATKAWRFFVQTVEFALSDEADAPLRDRLLARWYALQEDRSPSKASASAEPTDDTPHDDTPHDDTPHDTPEAEGDNG